MSGEYLSVYIDLLKTTTVSDIISGVISEMEGSKVSGYDNIAISSELDGFDIEIATTWRIQLRNGTKERYSFCNSDIPKFQFQLLLNNLMCDPSIARNVINKHVGISVPDRGCDKHQLIKLSDHSSFQSVLSQYVFKNVSVIEHKKKCENKLILEMRAIISTPEYIEKARVVTLRELKHNLRDVITKFGISDITVLKEVFSVAVSEVLVEKIMTS